MRKWHRWLSIVFGGFLLWISATGVLSQVGSLVNKASVQNSSQTAAPVGFTCPETMICRPKPNPTAWNVGLLHHLHSGETFGPVGTAISILSGLSLFVFAFSGLWMYVQMYRGRLVRVTQGKRHSAKFFW
jgi:uncharacterized iron-regulated membrane protein